jgi:hypothetical protein
VKKNKAALKAALAAARDRHIIEGNVRFHGESWRVSGRASEIAKTTFMTQSDNGGAFPHPV